MGSGSDVVTSNKKEYPREFRRDEQLFSWDPGFINLFGHLLLRACGQMSLRNGNDCELRDARYAHAPSICLNPSCDLQVSTRLRKG